MGNAMISTFSYLISEATLIIPVTVLNASAVDHGGIVYD
jgi:hypothetical protein